MQSDRAADIDGRCIGFSRSRHMDRTTTSPMAHDAAGAFEGTMADHRSGRHGAELDGDALRAGANVTVPWPGATRPRGGRCNVVDERGQLEENLPPTARWPLTMRVTARPFAEIVRFSLLLPVVGKLETESSSQLPNHWAGRLGPRSGRRRIVAPPGSPTTRCSPGPFPTHEGRALSRRRVDFRSTGCSWKEPSSSPTRSTVRSGCCRS